MSGGSVDRDWYKTLQKPAWASTAYCFWNCLAHFVHLVHLRRLFYFQKQF